MTPQAERLYELLPALYRIRDAERGEPLKAYLSVLAEQIAVLQENLDQLYDDQFIETCAEWVAPYIGGLIGYRTLHDVSDATRSARAEVANTIGYRRRKGTAAVLEQLARDVTGWPARAVEFFQLLGTTQYMNHVRPRNLCAVDMRAWEPLVRIGTGFDSLSHTIDVRHIATQGGRYNIPNIGLFLWRLHPYRLQDSPAVPLSGDAHRYRFSPLGQDIPLFTLPETEEEITHLANPINVPEPIRRRVLHESLDQYYGAILSLSVKTAAGPVDRSQVHVCDLSGDDAADWAHDPAAGIAIDPVLGRLAFPSGDAAPQDVRVSFHYGFSKDMGGGEYERSDSFDDQALPVEDVASPTSIQTALDNAASGGVVRISDNGRYTAALSITANSGAQVIFRARNGQRPNLVLPSELMIHIDPDATVILNGLLLSGAHLRVMATAGEGVRRLVLRHCTLVPGLSLNPDGSPQTPNAGSLLVEQSDLVLEIDHCIVGGLRTMPGVRVAIRDSIVDATIPEAIAYSAPDDVSPAGVLVIEDSTVIGKVHTQRMDLASNVIFFATLAPVDSWPSPVHSDQKQKGCVRFSFLPEGARVPRRYRCQPDLAIAAAFKEAGSSLTNAQEAAVSAMVRRRVVPAFTGSRYGQPAYMQLAVCTLDEIRAGADDESEMGAFHDLHAPQREINLRTRLDEYLRFGLEAGIFYET
jgi:hypothetical protein